MNFAFALALWMVGGILIGDLRLSIGVMAISLGVVVRLMDAEGKE